MHKNNGNSIQDSGFGSICSFSFDSKRSFEASTPKPKNNEKSATKITTNSQKQNVEPHSFSYKKATNCFKSFGENIEVHQVAHHKKTSVTNVSVDCKTIALISLILVFAVFIIAYKIILVAMPYTNTESFYEASTFAQEKFTQMLDWVHENKLSTRLSPLFCGLVISIFSIMMVYMDSAIPGVKPPLPFLANSKAYYGQPKNSSINLNYLTAFAAGIVVSAIMWYECQVY